MVNQSTTASTTPPNELNVDVVLPDNTEAETNSASNVTGENNQQDDTPDVKPENLYNYIASLYEKGGRLSKTYRSHFVSLKECSLRVTEKENLLELSQKNDKNYKTLLVLTDILMEQEPHKSDQPNLREDALITYIEYVVSHVGNLEKSGNTTIFQKWVDESEGYGKYSFLCGEIAAIKHGIDKDGKPKVIPEGQQSILKRVAAAWLFYKKHTNFEKLLKELSLSPFVVDNESSVYAEKRSVGFLIEMIGSPNKDGFAYLLNHIKNKNQEITNDKNKQTSENGRLRKENDALKQKLTELESKFAETTKELDSVRVTSHQLEYDLRNTEIQAGHHNIHQKDELKGVKGRIINFLENDVLLELKSASAANSREPPKSQVVERKLTNVIDFIGEQIKWLRK